ncbi:MAG: HAD family hydrolase [Planctomycetia bacterium]|nr:HAD family hydrolase [Planctomycetia bacterium]
MRTTDGTHRGERITAHERYDSESGEIMDSSGVNHTERVPGTSIEYIGPPLTGTDRVPRPRGVLFDFDGTLSLVREGWTELMVTQAVKELLKLRTGESTEELTRITHEFVTRQTGKPTIFQMIQLAEEIRQRGGTPADPLVYQKRFHQRLAQRTRRRRESLRDGDDPAAFLVPGSRELLEYLRERDVTLYLASGTSEADVVEELELLRIREFFGPRVWGARSDRPNFSKGWVVREQIPGNDQIRGPELLGFGDGYVEIQELRAVGGIAVAVASDERYLVQMTETERNSPDPSYQRTDAWKRQRLIQAGAHALIPDYRGIDPLLTRIFGE